MPITAQPEERSKDTARLPRGLMVQMRAMREQTGIPVGRLLELGITHFLKSAQYRRLLKVAGKGEAA